jgi:[ribosomal protein S18]-alanine N-acetyltransferase
MTIRRAGPDDAAAIARQMKVFVDEGGRLATESDTTLEQLTERFRESFGKGNISIVAEEDGEIVGGIGVNPSGIGGVAWLGMSIVAEHRGRGLGRELPDTAIEAAREAGYRKLELEVFPENARAIALYLRAGFEIEGLKRDHYPRRDGSIRSALLMALFLR